MRSICIPGNEVLQQSTEILAVENRNGINEADGVARLYGLHGFQSTPATGATLVPPQTLRAPRDWVRDRREALPGLSLGSI